MIKDTPVLFNAHFFADQDKWILSASQMVDGKYYESFTEITSARLASRDRWYGEMLQDELASSMKIVPEDELKARGEDYLQGFIKAAMEGNKNEPLLGDV